MSEIDRYSFTHKEVVEALIKAQGLHEGIWGLSVEFGIGAVNAGPSEDQILPTAVVPIVKMGIVKGLKENNLFLDAAKVNPVRTTSTPRKK